MSEMLTAAPSLLDLARQAAERAGEHPLVEQVFVFGSVARGEETADSDIDLFVLLNSDAVKEQCAEADRLVRAQIEDAVPPRTSLDVHVNRRSVYEHLCANATASFEHAISDHALLLYQSAEDLPPTRCRIENVPRDNFGIAVDRFMSLTSSLEAVRTHLDNVESAEGRIAEMTPEMQAHERRDRYVHVLAASHMAMEQACLAVRAAHDEKSMRSHDLDELLTAMPETAFEIVAPSLDQARESDGKLRNWRVSPYVLQEREWVDMSTASNAAAHAQAATHAARRVHSVLLDDPRNDGSRDADLERADAKIGSLEAFIISEATLEHGQSAGAAATSSRRRWWPFKKRSASPTRTDALPLPSRALSQRCGRKTLTGKRCRNPKPDPGGRCSAGHRH